MRLTEFLSPSAIKVPLEGTSKREVIHELVDLICAGEGEPFVEQVFQSVIERERMMSSGIGEGIALPHGFTPGSMTFAAALGIAQQPIDFEAIDGEPVTLVFLVISDEEHTNTKLKALARISRLLHRGNFRTALADSTSAADAMQVVVDEEARHRI
jgi:mannitol/fructose-specific phosphotransferase system IIA component (Ntr-type)